MNLKFFAGVFIGVLLALGVSYYLNISQFGTQSTGMNEQDIKRANPPGTINNTKSSDVISLAPGTTYSTESAEANSDANNTKKDTNDVNYTFYNVLKNNKEQDTSTKNAQADEQVAVKQVYATVGVFENINNANRFKQTLSDLGFEVSIIGDTKNDKPVNIVLVGPLDNNDTANTILDKLSRNKIEYRLSKY